MNRRQTVPEPFRHDDDRVAMINFAAYRQVIAKTPEQERFWKDVFEKFGGFDYGRQYSTWDV